MSKKSVLVLMTAEAEVNAKVRDFLTEMGMSVYLVSDQQSAVRVMKTKMVDLLICDTSVLSRLDDESLQNQLKIRTKSSELPLILISADIGEDQKSWFKRLSGVKALLPKPIDLNQVLRLVSANLPKDSKSALDLAEDDSDKPLVDPKDKISIEIGTSIKRLGAGASGTEISAFLTEYGESTVLVEVRVADIKKGEQLEVKVSASGTEGSGKVQFVGEVLAVEDMGSGSWLLTVNSQGAASELSNQITRQVVQRQSQLMDFIRKTQG